MAAYAMKCATSAGACSETPVSSFCAFASPAFWSDIALWVVSVFVLVRISLPVWANSVILGRLILPALQLTAAAFVLKEQTKRLENPA